MIALLVLIITLTLWVFGRTYDHFHRVIGFEFHIPAVPSPHTTDS